jgi:hypothetical protein
MGVRLTRMRLRGDGAAERSKLMTVGGATALRRGNGGSVNGIVWWNYWFVCCVLSEGCKILGR